MFFKELQRFIQIFKSCPFGKNIRVSVRFSSFKDNFLARRKPMGWWVTPSVSRQSSPRELLQQRLWPACSASWPESLVCCVTVL